MEQKNIAYTDIAILGGGAAGLMAAISAARETGGKIKITVIEKNARVGKKLLTTGNGRCNLSNRSIDASHYFGSFTDAAARHFERYSCAYIRQYFRSLGLFTRADQEGRVYPMSNSASSVLDVLRLALREYGVEERCGIEITSITQEENGGYFLQSEDEQIRCGVLIMTTGGKASLREADNAGYELARELGHTSRHMFPSLCPIPVKSAALRSLKGQRCQCTVSLKLNGQTISQEHGELQFTESTLSGICVFQLARTCIRMKKNKKRPMLCVDLLPEISFQTLYEELSRRTGKFNITLEELLTGIVTKRVALAALKECGLSPLDRRASEMGGAELEKLCRLLKGWEFEANCPNSFYQAQVTAGGIPVSEVNAETMASNKRDNLFFAGELLDLDGKCGGYNLHWAWVSGILAGKNAAAYLQRSGKK